MKTALDYSPICPLMLVFEDNKVNIEACDYEPETKACSMGCKRGRERCLDTKTTLLK